MYLGFYNFYSRYNQNRMFINPRSDIGDELAYPYVRLSQRLTERGIRHATLDMDDLSRFDAVIFFDFPTLLNRYFLRLAARRHPRLYLVLFEGPAVRPDNYFRPHHRPFRKIFTWHSDWVDGKKYLHSPFPIKLPAVAPYTPSQASRFLCMIASQKYSWHRQELYSERVRAIRWFETHHPEAFDLYGTRWDRGYFRGKLSLANPLLRRIYERFPGLPKKRPPASWKGAVELKREIMPAYRFNLAIENSAFPGGVTEKMLDGMFCGTVPVYLGDPQVEKLIPPGTFVDMRRFPDYGALHRHLQSMPEEDYEAIRRRIHAFITSEAVLPFGADAFAERIMRVVLDEESD